MCALTDAAWGPTTRCKDCVYPCLHADCDAIEVGRVQHRCVCKGLLPKPATTARSQTGSVVRWFGQVRMWLWVDVRSPPAGKGGGGGRCGVEFWYFCVACFIQFNRACQAPTRLR